MSESRGSPELRHALARKLRELRLKQGITQERLAFLARLHSTYISMLENGRKSPTVDALERIAQALGACPSIRLCSRIAHGFRWALAFSATAPALGAHYPPLNSSRRCRSGAKSSEDCGSSRSVATRPTPSPVLVTKTCGFPARI